ncbi:MAG: tRNA (N6-isopentenyl adenosine(37)-C2)-methylthiotransferase MiaB, partial [Desulfovibrio sp.]|nr:tRNA (N6-isopentenyl adenosine(37)-C2)-methylthiotransferase MiaB [Desulfovibrio sp.]
MEHWNFFCATFGCKVNQYETQALREAWTRAGGIETGEASSTDVLLVNS